MTSKVGCQGVCSSKESILMYSASNFGRLSINPHFSLPGLRNPDRVIRARGVNSYVRGEEFSSVGY